MMAPPSSLACGGQQTRWGYTHTNLCMTQIYHVTAWDIMEGQTSYRATNVMDQRVVELHRGIEAAQARLEAHIHKQLCGALTCAAIALSHNNYPMLQCHC